MTPNERLALLADKLDENAANATGMKFNLRTWLMTGGQDKTPHADCGTQGCAIGLACLIPEFIAEGFGYQPGVCVDWQPAFEGRRGWYAVRSFFGVEGHWCNHHAFQAEDWLFMADSYPERLREGAEGERAVATRIREYLGGKRTWDMDAVFGPVVKA